MTTKANASRLRNRVAEPGSGALNFQAEDVGRINNQKIKFDFFNIAKLRHFRRPNLSGTFAHELPGVEKVRGAAHTRGPESLQVRMSYRFGLFGCGAHLREHPTTTRGSTCSDTRTHLRRWCAGALESTPVEAVAFAV